MHLLKYTDTAVVLLAGAAFLGMADPGVAPEKAARVTPQQFAYALTIHQSQLIELYLAEGGNVNARAGQDRPILVSAILAGNQTVSQQLLAAGACADLADENGLTPLMAASLLGDAQLVQQLLPLATHPAATDHRGRNALHYAIAAGKLPLVEILLPSMPQVTQSTRAGRSALGMALEQGGSELLDLLIEHLPVSDHWSDDVLEVLRGAVRSGSVHQVKLLLAQHSTPPAQAGKQVPLLVYAIASGDTVTYRMLLECGADPNMLLPEKCDPDFLALLPNRLRDYIGGDKGITLLTLAAGLGNCDAVNALLAAGADRQRATLRYKMLPLYVAAETGKWHCAQILLGGGPAPEQLRIEISLTSQRAAVIKDGVPIFDTACSTGREGYSTRTGDFIITDKNRMHRSTIYKVDMPYFMRLSCLDFGMHEGVVPNHPASHGCIRLPGEAARKLFAEIPIGTVVTVK